MLVMINQSNYTHTLYDTNIYKCMYMYKYTFNYCKQRKQDSRDFLQSFRSMFFFNLESPPTQLKELNKHLYLQSVILCLIQFFFFISFHEHQNPVGLQKKIILNPITLHKVQKTTQITLQINCHIQKHVQTSD